MKLNLQDFLPQNYEVDPTFKQRRLALNQSNPSYNEQESFFRKNKASYDEILKCCGHNYSNAMFLIENLPEVPEEERGEHIATIRNLARWFKSQAIGVFDINEKEHLVGTEKIHEA